MPRGGQRKGAGRPATGKAKTETIYLRLDPKLKLKAIKKATKSLNAYIVKLIEEDLNIL